MIQAKLTGDWRRLGHVLTRSSSLLREVARRRLQMQAKILSRQIKNSLLHQSRGAFPPPHSPWTKYGRRMQGRAGSRILVKTTQLARAIDATPIGPDMVFVGILKGQINAQGQDLVQVGTQHEFGGQILIPVTPALKKYIQALLFRFPALKRELDARGIASKGMFSKSYIVIDIPKRPFIQPAYEDFMRGAQAAFWSSFWSRFFDRLGLGRSV